MKKGDCLWIWAISLFSMRHKPRYNRDLSRRSMHHIYMTEHELHFSRTRRDSESPLKSINWSTSPPFLSEYSGNANIICNSLKLSNAKTVSMAEKTGPGKRFTMLFEQELVKLMKSVLQRLTKLGAMGFFKPCVDTRTIAETCLLEKPVPVICCLWHG